MKVSIITASYNYDKYIEGAIKSVIAQTFADWELIIVDDGSCDNSVEIIKKYCSLDSRIKYFEHKSHANKGLKETIKLAISKCSGDWIAFLESDDEFLPDYLEEKIKVINSQKNVNLIWNKVEFLTDTIYTKSLKYKLNLFSSIQKNLSKKSFPRKMVKEFFRHNQILTFSCAMVKKDELINTNLDAPIDSQLDWWIWVHIASNGELYYIDKPLTSWRLHDKSYTTKTNAKRLISTPILAYYDAQKDSHKFKILWLIYLLCLILFYKTSNFIEKQIRKII